MASTASCLPDKSRYTTGTTNNVNVVPKLMPPTILSILRTVVVYIPMAIYFDALWGYIGIFIAIVVSNLLFGVAAYAWSRSMLNYEISKIAP